MLDQFLLTVNAWMTGGSPVAMLGGFLWGMVSVLLSPCHLASIPLIVGYVGGQETPPRGRQAVGYALLFSGGLFLTILLVGILCALLGRMLGDVGGYWTILVGLILLWVALDMLGLARCTLSGNLLAKFRLRGRLGAFVLGLGYGILSGSCTFGFIAPILAVITVQKEVASGAALILLFALGHCLPIAAAGSSTAFVRRLLCNNSFLQGGALVRKAAGALIIGLGLYFIARPFLGSGPG